MADYTLFIEFDLNNRFDPVTANKITITALTRNESAYVYDNKGAGFFDGDFTHKLDVQVGSVSGTGNFGVWCVANDVDDLRGLQNANKSDLHLLALKNATTEQIYLIENDSGTLYFDFVPALTYGAKFYYTIERDESIGTYGTIFCYVYTDSARTILFDTLSVTLHTSKKDYSIIYGVISNNTGSGAFSSAVIENLDLGLVVPDVFDRDAKKIIQSADTINKGVSHEHTPSKIVQSSDVISKKIN